MDEDKILYDLFYNKLSLENNTEGLVKKIMHPYDNMKDYIKYGNMFLNLK